MTAAILDRPEPRTVAHHFEPRGAAIELMTYRGGEVLLSGPAGTGKSRACLEKLHLMGLLNPGMRALILRKTQKSLASTGLVTFREKVAAEGIANGVLKWFGGSTQEAAAYRYRNGSTLVVGGLDDPTKIMSSEYDVIYVQEATEVTKNDWEACTSRLRNGIVSFQQLMADCNPDTDTHWLNQRCQGGATKMLLSRHEDNPVYFDEHGVMTAAGHAYIEGVLDRLTGVRYLRLRKGIWAAAEGVIYDTFDTAVHLIDRPTFDKDTRLCSAGIPWDWPRFWSIDFGYTHPLVLQRWAVDPDGRLYRYAEIYRTGRLVEDHAADVMDQVSRPGTAEDGMAGRRVWTEPKPQAVICDHDAEGRATFEDKTGLVTTAARKAVKDGIQAVQSRLKIAGDGRPRLFLIRGACTSRDQALIDRALPTCTEDEIGGYVWDGTKEAPVKVGDDGCLVAGTLVETECGPRRIEDVAAGDRVWTRDGLRSVLAAGMTDPDAELFSMPTPDGDELVGTGNHPVWTENRGWIRMDSVRYGDIMVTWDQSKQLCSVASASGATRSPMTGQHAATSLRGSRTSNEESETSTGKSGSPRTGLSHPATRFTTSTSIRSTTILTISRASLSRSTRKLIANAAENVRASLNSWRTSTASDRSPRAGTGPKLGAHGIGSTPRKPDSVSKRRVPEYASSAPLLTTRLVRPATGSAPTPASQRGAGPAVSTTSNAPANAVVRRSPPTGTPLNGSVPDVARRATRCSNRAPVFNLTVEGSPEYFANGVLVHNCDAKRYVVMHVDNGRTKWMRWV